MVSINLELFNERLAAADEIRDAGLLDEAVSAYQALIADYPERPEPHFKSGTALMRQGRSAEAECAYRRALQIRRYYPEAANNLGIILVGRGERDEALSWYRQALAMRPDFTDAHINIGNLLVDVHGGDEALYHFQRAVLLDGKSWLAHERVGMALRKMGRLTEAVASMERALELSPDSALGWNGLGTCHYDAARYREAEHCFEKALALDPLYLPAWHNRLLISNYQLLDRQSIFSRHLRFGEVMRVLKPDSPPARIDSHKRWLRVGFVSGDLRRHSVAYFIDAPLKYLDRSRYVPIAYFNHPDEDFLSEKLKPRFASWKNIFYRSDDEVADMIRDDHIDILIDLSGHCSMSRLGVFARQPAPIQCSWIGYPNTTGLDQIDYRLTDAHADPDGDDGPYHSESLWRLPDSFLCYTPPADAPDVSAPPALMNGFITFGSFNTRVKIGDPCLDLWCSVLKALPTSRMILKSVIGLGDDASQEALLAEFARRGVEEGRIELRTAAADLSDHLAAYADIDIALDTFPYHGTTTTCEAMWMGVPVITHAGDRHVSRVGVSLLRNVGLADLVAESAEDFVAIALELASNIETLAAFRANLRGHLSASQLFDGRAMASSLAAAFEGMLSAKAAVDDASLAGTVNGAPLNVESREPLRLHIGGKQEKQGWKIFNSMAGPAVDIVGDIRFLECFSDGCCTDIYASHVLEHVGLNDLMPTLAGTYRILSPGGRLYVSVPDLDILTWLFGNPGFNREQRLHVMRMLFGGQTDEFDFHKIGLNFENLSDYLLQTGFESVERVESFGIFDDTSDYAPYGGRISLNVIAVKAFDE